MRLRLYTHTNTHNTLTHTIQPLLAFFPPFFNQQQEEYGSKTTSSISIIKASTYYASDLVYTIIQQNDYLKTKEDSQGTKDITYIASGDIGKGNNDIVNANCNSHGANKKNAKC